MITVFFGADDFSAREALDELIAGLDTDGQLRDNTVPVDGASVKPDELLVQCQTVPFLSTHRLVLVRGLLGKFESARRGRRKKTDDDGAGLGAWSAFVDALPDLPETTALVFVDGALRAQNAFLKAVRPHAQVRELKALAQAEVAGWIQQRAPRHGANLQARAVAALASLVGNDLWTLDSEIEKLAVHANGAPISEGDVRAMVTLARDPSVFAMADAVVEGRVRDAADLLQRLLADGDSPQRLLAMVARQYRLLLLTKELLEQHVRPPQIRERLGVQNFAIQRLLKQAPAYTIESLQRAYRKLLDADLSVKRGIYDAETALELLLFELAALATTRRDGRQGYSTPPGGRPRPPSGAATAPSGRS